MTTYARELAQHTMYVNQAVFFTSPYLVLLSVSSFLHPFLGQAVPAGMAFQGLVVGEGARLGELSMTRWVSGRSVKEGAGLGLRPPFLAQLFSPLWPRACP